MTMAKKKKKKKIDFQYFGLSHRLYKRSEVKVGSEDQLQFLLKGMFVQEGSSETGFNHGKFEIKTFPSPYSVICIHQRDKSA